MATVHGESNGLMGPVLGRSTWLVVLGMGRRAGPDRDAGDGSTGPSAMPDPPGPGDWGLEIGETGAANISGP